MDRSEHELGRLIADLVIAVDPRSLDLVLKLKHKYFKDANAWDAQKS